MTSAGWAPRARPWIMLHRCRGSIVCEFMIQWPVRIWPMSLHQPAIARSRPECHGGSSRTSSRWASAWLDDKVTLSKDVGFEVVCECLRSAVCHVQRIYSEDDVSNIQHVHDWALWCHVGYSLAIWLVRLIRSEPGEKYSNLHKMVGECTNVNPSPKTHRGKTDSDLARWQADDFVCVHRILGWHPRGLQSVTLRLHRAAKGIRDKFQAISLLSFSGKAGACSRNKRVLFIGLMAKKRSKLTKVLQTKVQYGLSIIFILLDMKIQKNLMLGFMRIICPYTHHQSAVFIEQKSMVMIKRSCI